MKTLVKGLEIMELLAEEKRELGVTEISRKLDINKSTVTKLLHTFLDFGYVFKSVSTGKYYLGMKCAILGELASNMNGIVDIARPYMQELSRITEETINLAIRDGFHACYVDMVRSPNTIAVQTTIGGKEYLHCSSVGKVLLAAQNRDFWEQYAEGTKLPRMCQNTITDFSALQVELELVRTHGFACDDEESETAIRCVGVPICDYNGKVIAAMSISSFKLRFTNEREKEHIALLTNASKEISKKLGYMG